MSVKGRKARLAVTAGLAAALALGGVVAPVAQAYADGGYTVTIESTSGYQVEGQYKVYCLFTGSFADTNTDSGKMGNAVANDSYREDMRTVLNTFLADGNKVPAVDAAHSQLVVDTAIADGIASLPEARKQEFANKLAAALKDKAGFTSVNADNGTLSVTGLEAGYYLIVNPDVGNNAMTSAILVPVNHDRKVTIKASTPTVTKQTKLDGGEPADNVDIGLTGANTLQKVTYVVTGTVASNIDDYNSYEYVITDTLPKGLKNTVTQERINTKWNVSISAVSGGKTVSVKDKFALSLDTSGSSPKMIWTCNDLIEAMGEMNHRSAQIVLTYTPDYTPPELEGSLEGAMGAALNSVTLTYSNNPYAGGTGSTAITPADESKVYTYKLALNKVKADADNGTSPLAGAKFTLRRAGTEVFTDLEVGANGALAFTGLDSGVEYELSETTVPAGMKSIDPIKFKITATKNDATGEVTSVKVNTGDVTDNSHAATFDADDKFDDNVIHVTVKNIEGANLPLTGQQGIVAGVAVGGIVLTVSLVAISRNRKRSE